MRIKQAGFTLIELVVVITILGILAAVALPRFVDLQGSARLAKLQGAAGAVKSASALAHSAAIVSGTYPGETTISMEGMTINLANHYPAPTAPGNNGIADAAQLSTGDYAFDATTTSGMITISSITKPTCSFSYTQTATSQAPVITTSSLTSGNC